LIGDSVNDYYQCKLVEQTATNTTCLCDYPIGDTVTVSSSSRRGLKAKGKSKGGKGSGDADNDQEGVFFENFTHFSCTYMAMIDTVTSDFTATLISAKDLNLSTIQQNLTVFLTLVSLLAIAIVMMVALHYLDEYSAQQIEESHWVKKRKQHKKASAPSKQFNWFSSAKVYVDEHNPVYDERGEWQMSDKSQKSVKVTSNRQKQGQWNDERRIVKSQQALIEGGKGEGDGMEERDRHDTNTNKLSMKRPGSSNLREERDEGKEKQKEKEEEKMLAYLGEFMHKVDKTLPDIHSTDDLFTKLW
jgi:hypothetical protein